MRIHTSAPSNANDTAGTVIGTQTSTRETKQDIANYTDYDSALSMILNTPLHTFRYIKEVQGYGVNSPLAKIRIGYIADEVDPNFMVGNAIDQVSVNGILMASIKELNLKITEMQNNQLTNKAESIGQHTGELLSGIMEKISDGVVYIKGLALETLKVGSPTKRTGITIYDEVTGDPYCLSIANGVQKTTLGECVIVNGITSIPPNKTTTQEEPTSAPSTSTDMPTETTSTEIPTSEPENISQQSDEIPDENILETSATDTTPVTASASESIE